MGIDNSTPSLRASNHVPTSMQYLLSLLDSTGSKQSSPYIHQDNNF